jgi:hypothetical protein
MQPYVQRHARLALLYVAVVLLCVYGLVVALCTTRSMATAAQASLAMFATAKFWHRTTIGD